MGRTQAIVTGFDPDGPFAGLLLPPRFIKRQRETRFKQRWTVTSAQYAALMREGYELRLKRWVPMPNKQRGSIQMGSAGAHAAAAVSVPSGIVGLSAHTVTDQRFDAGTAEVQWQFLSNGQLWINRVVGSNSQPNNEWWSLEPDTGVGVDYETRHLSAGKIGTFSSEAAAADAWITIGSTRNWAVTRTSTGTKSCTATFEVGDDGAESADDSAVFIATASVDDV